MDQNARFSDGVSLIQPPSRAAMLSPGAVVLCPWPLAGGFRSPDQSVADFYRLAYLQAGAALEPPWHERNLLASWN
jgi:hypothetical protein